MLSIHNGNDDLAAYFDESGTNRERSTALTVAGYISTVARWEEFRVEWQKMLDDQCLEYFHMTDLETFHKQFTQKRGWCKERKELVLQRAHDIINRHVIQDFDSSLIWADYDEVIKAWQRPAPPTAYNVLVNACLSQVGDWVKAEGYREKVAYVFEKGVHGWGALNVEFNKILNSPKTVEAFRWRSISFEDKRFFLPLQAADVIAFEQCKQMQNRIVDGPHRDLRLSFANLKYEKDEIRTKYFEREGLAKYIAAMEVEDAP